MFSLEQIKTYFPPYIDQYELMIKEYLQYKILKLIFQSSQWAKLSFLWWTALRIVYANTRFSEDLDFDNFGLSFEEFGDLSEIIAKGLRLEWLEVEFRTIQKWAFHCHIKLPHILYDNQLAAMSTQKILIQIDTVAQWYDYVPTITALSKFDTQTTIKNCSPSLLLAQKLYTVFERKRMKGRDFHDIVFLSGITQQPDWWYLALKMNITSADQLHRYLADKCKWVDFDALQQDVQPFLFQTDNQSVKLFPQLIEQIQRK
jgi:predicted nucleotidyltransferase component of viral defense system